MARTIHIKNSFNLIASAKRLSFKASQFLRNQSRIGG